MDMDIKNNMRIENTSHALLYPFGSVHTLAGEEWVKDEGSVQTCQYSEESIFE